MNATPLSTDERAACGVCAAWLATGVLCSQAAGLAVLAVLAAALAGGRLGASAPVLLVLLALGVAERVLALRVTLDARLFARLASGELATLAALDAGLQQVLQVPQAKAGRSLAARCAGAQRLYRGQMLCVLALITLNFVAWWPL